MFVVRLLTMLLFTAVALQPIGVFLVSGACCNGDGADSRSVAVEQVSHEEHACCGGKAPQLPADSEPTSEPGSDPEQPTDRDCPCECPMACCAGKVMPTTPPSIAASIVPAASVTGATALPSDAVRSSPHLRQLKRPPRVFTLV